MFSHLEKDTLQLIYQHQLINKGKSQESKVLLLFVLKTTLWLICYYLIRYNKGKRQAPKLRFTFFPSCWLSCRRPTWFLNLRSCEYIITKLLYTPSVAWGVFGKILLIFSSEYSHWFGRTSKYLFLNLSHCWFIIYFTVWG